jgi:hypothetical protein
MNNVIKLSNREPFTSRALTYWPGGLWQNVYLDLLRRAPHLASDEDLLQAGEWGGDPRRWIFNHAGLSDKERRILGRFLEWAEWVHSMLEQAFLDLVVACRRAAVSGLFEGRCSAADCQTLLRSVDVAYRAGRVTLEEFGEFVVALEGGEKGRLMPKSRPSDRAPITYRGLT